MDYWIDPAKSKYRNEILIAQIFCLKNEYDRPFDVNSRVILKKFPLEVIPSEFKKQMEAEANKVYHNFPLKLIQEHQDLNYFQIQEIFNQEINDEVSWKQNYKENEIVYQSHELGESVGCQHYISGCQQQCFTCKQFFGCRRCHDEQIEDHVFPKELTERVKCNFCEHIQKFGSACEKCGENFGNLVCPKCKYVYFISPDVKMAFHCDKCGVCRVGQEQTQTHCDQCNTCMLSYRIKTHDCVEVSDCIVCMGNLKSTKYDWYILECKHQIHAACYSEMMSRANYKCPICTKYLPVKSDRPHVLERLKRFYKTIFILPQMVNQIVQIKCNDCGGISFAQKHTSQLYFCEACQIFNGEETGKTGTVLEFYVQNLEVKPPQPTEAEIGAYLLEQIGDLRDLGQIKEITGMEIKGNELFFATLINRFTFGSVEEFLQRYLQLAAE